MNLRISTKYELVQISLPKERWLKFIYQNRIKKWTPSQKIVHEYLTRKTQALEGIDHVIKFGVEYPYPHCEGYFYAIREQGIPTRYLQLKEQRTVTNKKY